MSFIELPIRLPRTTLQGELINSNSVLGRVIGSGQHGTAHEGVLNGERVCLKRYHFAWSHAFIPNPAKNEYNRLMLARQELDGIVDSVQEPIGWFNDPRIGPVLATHLVKDHSGQPSQTLKDVSEVSLPFVCQLESLFAVLASRQVFYNPLPVNILVQRTSPDESRPILIDLTNYECRLHYPGKSALHLVAPSTKQLHISAWHTSTLDFARSKISKAEGASLHELVLPSRDSIAPASNPETRFDAACEG